MANEVTTTVAHQVIQSKTGDPVDLVMSKKRHRHRDSIDRLPGEDSHPEGSTTDNSDQNSPPLTKERTHHRRHSDSESDGESSSGSTSAGNPHGIRLASQISPSALEQQFIFPTISSAAAAAMSGRMNANRAMRPFKAYTASRDLLSYAGLGAAGLHPYAAALSLGMPTLPPFAHGMHPSLAPHLMSLATEAARTMQPHHSQHLQMARKRPSPSSTVTTASALSTSSSSSSPRSQVSPDGNPSPSARKVSPGDRRDIHSTATSHANSSLSQKPSSSSPSSELSASEVNPPKKRRSLPDELKDESYWERRRKNNDAAKRSRDIRKAKEDEIAIRAALLEQENIRLRVEVASLKEETARLRCVLYNS